MISSRSNDINSNNDLVRLLLLSAPGGHDVAGTSRIDQRERPEGLAHTMVVARPGDSTNSGEEKNNTRAPLPRRDANFKTMLLECTAGVRNIEHSYHLVPTR